MNYFADIHLEIEADTEEDALEVLTQCLRAASVQPGVQHAWEDGVEEDERP